MPPSPGRALPPFGTANSNRSAGTRPASTRCPLHKRDLLWRVRCHRGAGGGGHVATPIDQTSATRRSQAVRPFAKPNRTPAPRSPPAPISLRAVARRLPSSAAASTIGHRVFAVIAAGARYAAAWSCRRSQSPLRGRGAGVGLYRVTLARWRGRRAGRETPPSGHAARSRSGRAARRQKSPQVTRVRRSRAARGRR